MAKIALFFCEFKKSPQYVDFNYFFKFSISAFKLSISSFNALNERTQNPMAVTAGIVEALITTVFGLCIAIMGMCIHAYLTSKIKTETLNINEVADTLVDIFKANEQSK